MKFDSYEKNDQIYGITKKFNFKSIRTWEMDCNDLLTSLE